MSDLPDCLFCKVVNAEIAADILYGDDDVLAFRDIDPQAPVHILVIPVRHSPNAVAAADEELDIIGKMVQLAGQLASDEGIADSGYRMVFNTGADGGQTVPHTHLHLLGGRRVGWPPG